MLSSGLDSTVTLATFLSQGGQLELVLTFDYGQRAAKREVERSAAICAHYDLRHEVVTLPWLGNISQASLTRGSGSLSLDEASDGPQQLWVPNRNGVFVNVAAAYAEAQHAEAILIGLNADEAERFPDNTAEFVAAETGALLYSTLTHPVVLAPCAHLRKSELVALARQLEVPLELTWPCYAGGDDLCWECASCKLFRQALETAGCWNWYQERRTAEGN